jgi:hypothetical protein
LGRLTATNCNSEREAMQERQAEAKNRAFTNSVRAEALALLQWEHRSSRLLCLEDLMRFFRALYPLLYIAQSIHMFGKNKVMKTKIYLFLAFRIM